MKTKDVRSGCRGAGMWAKRKMPTSLVDCPECARKDLGSEPIRWEGGCDGSGYSSEGVCYYGKVPFHRPLALRPEQIPDFESPSPALETEFRAWCNASAEDRERRHTNFDDVAHLCDRI